MTYKLFGDKSDANILLTVIVPVFNVEAFLTECITSIINQTFTSLEIILVNDGSTDNSPIICEEFSKKDPRIKVIHQPNGGVSAARNSGIALSTGGYITFVDSDDWLEEDMFQKLVNAARYNQEPDVVMCDYITVRDSDTTKITSNLREGFYSKKDIIREVYPTLLVTEDFGRLPIVSVWNCLFKKFLFDNNTIEFDETLHYSEDYLFMADVMTQCESYFYLKNYFGYHYRQYEESRSKKYQPEWWINLVSLSGKLKNLLSGYKEYDFTRQLKLQLIHSALFISSSIYNNHNMRYALKVTILNTIFREPSLKPAFSDLKFNTQSISLRIVLFLIKLRMPLIYLIFLKALSEIKTITNSK